MRPVANRPAAVLAVVVTVAVTAMIGIVLSTSRGGAPSSSATVVETAEKHAVQPNYVAIGSSFAAGPGDGPIVDRGCLRTGDNYPSQVAEQLGLKLIDVTCSGSTAAELVTGPKDRRSQRRPQIEAVDADTELVTITTGGNDIDFVGRLITEACTNLVALGLLPSCGSGRLPPAAPTTADYARLEASLVSAVKAIKARAPRADVVIVDYTPVVSVNAPMCPMLPLAPWNVVQDAQIADEMSAVNQRVADRTGADHVVTTGLADEHSVCGPEPWARGFGKGMAFHPNASGKAGIADLVVESVRGES